MTLLDELKGDRVALVAFAGDAFIQCPLTSDYEAAKLFLRAVDPYQMPQGGTNIGGALEIAKEVFDGADRGSKDRVVVLLSDGEDVFGDVKEGLRTLKDAGIKIYTVGIGSETGEPIPLEGKNGEFVGYQKDERGETVLTRMDRPTLVGLAEESGGEFFYQPRGVAMREVVGRIDKLQKSDLESRIAVRFDERFQTYLAIGLALWVAAMLMRASRKVEPA
jgi:Ca-activated chloride channel family protein